MLTIKELREKLAALYKEGVALVEQSRAGTLNADGETRLAAINDEASDLRTKLDEAEARETRNAAIMDGDKQYNKPAGTRASAMQPVQGAARESQRDTRSLGARFAASDAVKQYRGQEKSEAFDVGSFFHRSAIEHNSDTTPQELRTLIYGGALAADMVRPQLVPGIFRGDDKIPGLRDVLINGTTTSDAITFFRELAFTNAAAGVAEASNTSDTSGTKPESALTFEQDTAAVKTLAHWIPITRQAVDDTAQLQTYVEQRLLDGLKLEESDQLLNGTGSADLTGILQTSNIQVLDATYFAANPVQNAGDLNENFNRLLRAKTKIAVTGRGRASFYLINPSDMEVLMSITNQMGNYYGSGPFTNGIVPTLWGLPVVIDENIAAGTVLTGDGRMAAVWDRMQAQIFLGTIDKQFIRNMFTILAEERLALTVFRPSAFASVTLAAV